jgi:hypothetical protein
VQLGALAYHTKRGKYIGVFSMPVKPTSIQVVSSEGGSAISAVGGK